MDIILISGVVIVSIVNLWQLYDIYVHTLDAYFMF